MGRPPKNNSVALLPPIHESYRRGYCGEGHPAMPLKRRPPGDLSGVVMDKEAVQLLERQSLEIFTLMSNAGYTFAESLSAILLSGIQWGVNGTKKLVEKEET